MTAFVKVAMHMMCGVGRRGVRGVLLSTQVSGEIDELLEKHHLDPVTEER
jgi:hypothetical protein